MARCYEHVGLVNHAINEYETAIMISPKFIPAYNNLGGIYFELKKYDKALVFFAKGKDIDPSFPDIMENYHLTLKRLNYELKKK